MLFTEAADGPGKNFAMRKEVSMFISLIRKRRSIRKYLEKDIEAEKINTIIEAALRAPSSRGLQPWEFIVVTDRDSLDKLSGARPHGSAHLKNAPLGIVVCADPDRCDTWIEDSAIASVFIQLTAESLGLGNCWIQIRDRMHNDTKTAEEYISKLLAIPEKMKVECIIAIGYPDEEKQPYSQEALLYDKVHLKRYGNPYASQLDEG
jgi:nitroreductase